LWRAVQSAVDAVLTGVTLRELLQKESDMKMRLVVPTPAISRDRQHR